MKSITQFPGEDMNSAMTHNKIRSRVAVQPASGFISFGDDEIEQSIPQRFEQQVRAVAIVSQ